MSDLKNISTEELLKEIKLRELRGQTHKDPSYSTKASINQPFWLKAVYFFATVIIFISFESILIVTASSLAPLLNFILLFFNWLAVVYLYLYRPHLQSIANGLILASMPNVWLAIRLILLNTFLFNPSNDVAAPSLLSYKALLIYLFFATLYILLAYWQKSWAASFVGNFLLLSSFLLAAKLLFDFPSGTLFFDIFALCLGLIGVILSVVIKNRETFTNFLAVFWYPVLLISLISLFKYPTLLPLLFSKTINENLNVIPNFIVSDLIVLIFCIATYYFLGVVLRRTVYVVLGILSACAVIIMISGMYLTGLIPWQWLMLILGVIVLYLGLRYSQGKESKFLTQLREKLTQQTNTKTKK